MIEVPLDIQSYKIFDKKLKNLEAKKNNKINLKFFSSFKNHKTFIHLAMVLSSLTQNDQINNKLSIPFLLLDLV